MHIKIIRDKSKMHMFEII